MKHTFSSQHLQQIERVLSLNGISFQDIKFLARGANNIVYRINCTHSTLIAKIGINSSFRNLDKEYIFLRKIQSVGPEVLFFDTDPETGLQLLIETFVEGSHLFSLNNQQLEHLGKTIAIYHNSSYKQFNFPRDSWLDFINVRIPRPEQKNDELRLCEAFDLWIEQAKLRGAMVYANRSSAQKVLIHGDLIPLNILFDKDNAATIIDWEGVRIDDAEADLATFIKAFRLTEDNKITFLSRYERQIDQTVLNFRLLLHYIQVIGWRLSMQIPIVNGEEKDKAVEEVLEEKQFVEKLLSNEK